MYDPSIRSLRSDSTPLAGDKETLKRHERPLLQHTAGKSAPQIILFRLLTGHQTPIPEGKTSRRRTRHHVGIRKDILTKSR